MSHPHPPHSAPMRSRALLLPLSVMLAWSPLQVAQGADTDISNQPLIHAQNSQQPNLMFLLDNSGSMDNEFLPEKTGSRGRYAIWSWHCNSLAFNPTDPSPGHYEGLYKLPVTHDGRNYPNMKIGAAWPDGFVPSMAGTSYALSTDIDTDALADGGTRSLAITVLNFGFANKGDTLVLKASDDDTHWLLATVTDVSYGFLSATYSMQINYTSFRQGIQRNWVIGKPTTVNLLSTGNSPQTHFYYQHSNDNPATDREDPARPWKYTSSGAPDESDTYVQQCMSTVDTLPSVFTKKLADDLDATRQQQFANWYSYYRNRKLLMRTAAGLAMMSMPSNFRVGFNALNKNRALNPDVTNTLFSFAHVGSFNTSQRRLFYSNLYGTPTGGGTPLRRALAKIGQYYGNRLTGQSDPIISSCQANYGFVTTDGYWNDDSNPTQLDGKTAIGNQDGMAPAPQNDGSFDYTTTETRTTYTLLTGGNCKQGKGKGNSEDYYRSYEETRTLVTTPSGTTPGPWTAVPGGDRNQCGNMPNSPTVTSTSTGGPASNTLADVAYYYYNTDLRSDWADQVPAVGDDTFKGQHMTTYTLGLGLSGRLPFTADYAAPINATDDADVRAGKQTFIDLSNTSLSPRLYWPIPPNDYSDHPAKIDDLWHAAVNGRGKYFSATNASNLTSSLTDAIDGINRKTGAGSSAATTSLRPVLGTDQVFVARYSTVNWTGELEAQTIVQTFDNKTKSNVISLSSTGGWTVSAALTARSFSGRQIYYARNLNSTQPTLGTFDWSTLGTDNDSAALQGHFSNFCSKVPLPDQCATMTSSERTAASGANLVNFLRGDGSNEGTLYRSRKDPVFVNQRNVLGDIVDASPVYVGKPPFSYTGNGYPTWKSADARKNRCPMVYVAANDGMLHAFSARTSASVYANCPTAGTEAWAYVPRGVMSQLYRLADTQYKNRHVFTVNGGPVVGDVSTKVSNGEGGTTDAWHTILVGGLGAGGRSYYALDVTNPVPISGDSTSGPKLLWEFSDPDLGLTYSNPMITQIPVVDPSNGTSTLTWAVVFASGLNNGVPGANAGNSGDGNGYLYVLNAMTGQLIYKVPTLVNGSDPRASSNRSGDHPTGFNKINVWVNTPSDNVAEYIYGTDMLGNVWRFAANNLYRAATTTGNDLRATRVAQLVKDGVTQPITIRPELAEVTKDGINHRVVLLGTGRYLGNSDASDLSTPSTVYAIKDTLSTTGWSNVRNNMVAQTLTNATRTETQADGSSKTVAYRTITANTVDWSASTSAGWYVDLIGSGERVSVPMNLAYNILSVASMIPNTSDPCSNGGDSWLYDLDIMSGSYIKSQTSTQQGGYKSDKAIMGINTVQYDGTNQSGRIITNADGSTSLDSYTTPGVNAVRRTAWRELTQ